MRHSPPCGRTISAAHWLSALPWPCSALILALLLSESHQPLSVNARALLGQSASRIHGSISRTPCPPALSLGCEGTLRLDPFKRSPQRIPTTAASSSTHGHWLPASSSPARQASAHIPLSQSAPLVPRAAILSHTSSQLACSAKPPSPPARIVKHTANSSSTDDHARPRATARSY